VLENAGLVFDVDPADVDENAIKQDMSSQGVAVEAIAMTLAEKKAQVVSMRRPQAWVIGADQVLVLENRIFDKPADMKEASSHLRQFRGRSHDLISAVCVIREQHLVWRHTETITLHVREYSDTFLEKYLSKSGNSLLDSVGAYRLEGLGAQLFSRVDGDYFSVLGLPLLPLLGFLRGQGVIAS
tara:strand:- start:672 stop:1223 length:552 start_codon:yes stop_codon:yes gene_type:complete